ncbi:MAG: amidase [Pseudomonadota bacterium]
MTDWLDADATAQAEARARGELTSEALMAATLERIAARNPALTAIVALREADALMAEARAADETAPRSWLHGLPIAVKDLVDVAGIRSTSGSPIYADHVPKTDGLLAHRLRQAGAILIGKTNVPEFGLGSHSMNPVYGTTLNPYDTTRSAGGSSGGAGAALAARMVAVADGSDAMGSLRNPAGWNNIYSLRPTWGLIPGEPGGDMYMHPLSTLGPMARSPRDVAGLLQILAQPDPRVPLARSLPPLDPGRDVAGLRLGWLADWGGAYPMEEGILDTCATALEALDALGCIVEPLPAPFPASDIWQSWTTLRSFAQAGAHRSLYADPTQRALLKPEMQWEIERGLALDAEAVLRASELRSAWFARAARLFETYDALILPSAQCWPFPAAWRYPQEITGRALDTYHRWMEVVTPVSLLGLPAVTLPAGFGGPHDLPIGLQVFARPGADPALLTLAEAYDAATRWPDRRPPPVSQTVPPAAR